MPNWLIILMSRIATTGVFAVLSTRQGMLFGGFSLLMIGSMFSSIPFVLIGAFVILWSTTRAIEDSN